MSRRGHRTFQQLRHEPQQPHLQQRLACRLSMNFIAMAMQLGDRPFYEQMLSRKNWTRLQGLERKSKTRAKRRTRVYGNLSAGHDAGGTACRGDEYARRSAFFRRTTAIIDAINRIKRENKGADHLVITSDYAVPENADERSDSHPCSTAPSVWRVHGGEIRSDWTAKMQQRREL